MKTQATALAAALSVLGLACGDGDESGDMDGLVNPPADATEDDVDSATGTRWEARAPVGGGPIQETAVVALDGKVYLLGGFDELGGESDAVRVYDPAADAWSEAAPLPMPVHHANAAVVDGTLYVTGALRSLGFTPINNVWAYSPDTDEWTERTPIPVARGSSAVGVIDGKIYVAGGLGDGGPVADAAVYDPANDEWTAIAPLPEARDHLAGAAVDGFFYAIGGRRGEVYSITGRVDAFDPTTGEWSARAPMITPRGGTAAGVVLNAIYVVGGEGNPDADTGVFPQAEAYFPATDSWMTLPDMRTPRHGMGAAGIGNILYVPGGANTDGFDAVDTHEVLIVNQL